MLAYSKLGTLVTLSVALAAGISYSTPATAHRLRVQVQAAIFDTVPWMQSAIGNIEPGTSPVIKASSAGQLTQILTPLGSRVRPRQALAYLQPLKAAPTGTPILTVRTPVQGRICRVLAPVGETVRVGQPLFGIEGKEVREARAPFRLRLASRLHVGETVLLHSPLAPRSPLTGTVARLAVHRKRHVIYALITLPARRGWVSGSPVRVDVITKSYRGLVIPKDAVHLRRVGTVVFVLHGGTVRMQRVEIEEYLAHRAVIRSGLSANTLVVTEAQGRLTNGARVKVRKAPSL